MGPLPQADLEHVLNHTAGLWSELRGARLFITGGTGFVGCWLLETFLHAATALRLGAQAMVLTRDVSGFQRRAPHLATRPELSFFPGDVRSFDFPVGEFTHIIHAASPVAGSFSPAEALQVAEIILHGTGRVSQFAHACQARKLLFVSSGAVYGRQPPELSHLPESFSGASDPAEPRSAYGEAKRLAELLCSLAGKAYGFEVKIARCFALVGPRLPLEAGYAIGNFIRDGLRGGPIVVTGDGTPYRSYLYAADLAIWLWTILLAGPAGQTYNVGSEQAVTIAETARRVATVLGCNATIEVRQRPTMGRPAERYVPSTQKARNELGLAEYVGLDQAIRRTAEWYRQQR